MAITEHFYSNGFYCDVLMLWLLLSTAIVGFRSAVNFALVSRIPRVRRPVVTHYMRSQCAGLVLLQVV
jgi:hypothetical protein